MQVNVFKKYLLRLQTLPQRHQDNDLNMRKSSNLADSRLFLSAVSLTRLLTGVLMYYCIVKEDKREGIERKYIYLLFSTLQ